MRRELIFITLLLLLPLISSSQTYWKERNRMVKNQIINRGIEDEKVIEAMREVERHKYVPEKYRNNAYDDRPLPIGHGQTISQPYIVALMTEVIDIKEGEKILEVGTGSGYQAAVLSHITSEVYSIEIIEALAREARETLQDQGYQNIKLKIGDGYKGWKEYAPFDAIIVTCSPSDIPDPLIEQLKDGGRMIIPVGGQFIQELVLVTKKGNTLIREEISAVRFVPMLDEDGKRY